MYDGSMFIWVIAAIMAFWVVPPFVAYELMKEKGRSPGAGIGLGLVFGWIGVLIAACLSIDQAGLAHSQSAAATREP